MVIEDFVRDWLDGLEKKYDIGLTEKYKEEYILAIVDNFEKSIAGILLQAERDFLEAGVIKIRKGDNQ